MNAADGRNARFVEAARIVGHPTILVFDREGSFVKRLLGPGAAGDLEAVVAPLVAR